MLTSDLNESHIAYCISLFSQKNDCDLRENVNYRKEKKEIRKVEEGAKKLSMKRVEFHPQYVSFLV